MNMITNSNLDSQQRQLIYELTLKKRQSKKSTMSEKQVAARQQLARELMLERIIPIEDSIFAHNQLLMDSSTTISITNNDDHFVLEADQPSTSGSIDTFASSSSSNATGSSSGCCLSLAGSSSIGSSLNQKFISNQQPHHNIPLSNSSPSCNSCGCSFGRSDSSYSGSSQASNASDRMMIIDELSRHDEELRSLKKEANIKFNKTRLEHLNEELERKLYQYEYLVTKEKALLGAYNMVLFTNEGVNNFY